jgi:hypothetical protein
MYHLIFLPRKQSLGVYRNHHAPVEIHLCGLKFSPSITCNISVHVCPDIYMYKIAKCFKTRWFNYQYHLKGLWCKKTVVIKKTNILVSCRSKLAVAHGNQNVTWATWKRRKIAQLGVKNSSSPVSLNYRLSVCIVIVFLLPVQLK